MEEEINQNLNSAPEKHPHIAWRIIIVMVIVAIVGGVGYFVFSDSLRDILFEAEKSTIINNKETLEETSLRIDDEIVVPSGLTLEEAVSLSPDTDGDGYSDGEEIANGFNPLIPSPGDEL